MFSIKKNLIIGLTSVLGGCTTLNVVPVKEPVKSICIIKNEKVTIPHFSEYLDKYFIDNNIKITQVEAYDKNNTCDAHLEYTARRSFDFVTFISLVDLNLYRTSDKKLIGSLTYNVDNDLNEDKYASQVDILPSLVSDLFRHSKDKI